MVIYVIYKVHFYLWVNIFSLLEGMVMYDNEFKTKENIF